MSDADPSASRENDELGRSISSNALDAAVFLENIRAGEAWLNFAGEKFVPTVEEEERLKLTIKLLMHFAVNIEDASLNKFHFNQLKALQDFKNFLQNAGYGRLSGYIHQATGSGKTVLFALIAKLLEVKTLVLVPKTNLLEQTKGEFVNMLGFDENEIGILGGGKTETDKNTTISTYQSHMSLMKRDPEYRRRMAGVELVICDEAHKGLGEETQESIDRMDNMELDEMDAEDEFEKNMDNYVSRIALRIGFTATPKLAEKDVSKFFGKLISRVTMAEMVKAGILKNYRIVQAGGSIETSSENISEQKETEILEREQIYEKLLDKYLETRKTAPYSLKVGAFCPNISECEKFLKIAESKGLKGMIVTSKIGKDSLEEAENKLLCGDIDMIITVDKLTEGWNFPSLNSVIWARACGSPARIIQAAGRAARYFEGQPYAYFFETNWKISRKTKYNTSEEGDEDDGKEGEEDSGNEDDGKEGYKGDEKSKHVGSLTLTKALYESGEDIDVLCEAVDGNKIEFTKVVMLDENGCGVVTIESEGGKVETFEVLAIVFAYAKLHDTRTDNLKRKVLDSGLTPIEGVMGKSGTHTLPLYRKSDIDKLFQIKTIALDENNTALIQLTGANGVIENVEVLSIGHSSAKLYAVVDKTLRRKILDADLTPIEGVMGKSGVNTVPLYRKSEVDKLFQIKTITLDGNGTALIQLTGTNGVIENVEVLSIRSFTARLYTIRYGNLRRKLLDSGLTPIEGVMGKSGKWTVPLYRKSDLDKLFGRG